MTANPQTAFDDIRAQLQEQAADFVGEPLTALLERHRVISRGHFKMRGYCSERQYSLGKILLAGERLELQQLAARFLVYIEDTGVDLLVAHSDLMFTVAQLIAQLVQCQRGWAPEVLRAIDGPGQQHLLGRYGELKGKSVGILVDVVNTGKTVEKIAGEVERRFGAVEFVGAVAYLGNFDGELAHRMFALLCDPAPIYGDSFGQCCPMCARNVPAQGYEFDAGTAGDRAAVCTSWVWRDMQEEAGLWALIQSRGAFESHRAMGQRHIPVFIRTGELLADTLGYKLISERAAKRFWYLKERAVALVIPSRRPAARALAEALIDSGVFGARSKVVGAVKRGDVLHLEEGFAGECSLVMCWDVAIGTGKTARQLLAAVAAAGWPGRALVGALFDRRQHGSQLDLPIETCFRVPFAAIDVGKHGACSRCGSTEARMAVRGSLSPTGRAIHEKIYSSRRFSPRAKRKAHQMLLFNDLQCVLGPTLRAEACIQHYLDTGDYTEIAALLGVGNESVTLKREVIARMPVSFVQSVNGQRVMGGVLANSQYGDTLMRAGLKCAESGDVEWLSADWVERHKHQIFGERAWRALVPALEESRAQGGDVAPVVSCIRGLHNAGESQAFQRAVAEFLGVWSAVE